MRPPPTTQTSLPQPVGHVEIRMWSVISLTNEMVVSKTPTN